MNISERAINKAMGKVDFNKSVEELYEIKKEVRAVHDNQSQIIPALITIWDRVAYNTELLQKMCDTQKLSYKQPPKEHEDMTLERN